MSSWSRRALLILCQALLIAAAGCAQEEYPAWLWAEQHPAPPDGGPDTSIPLQGPILCNQARAQSLPARLVAISAQANNAADNIEPASDILFRVTSTCGVQGCHADPLGGFQVPSDIPDFVTDVQNLGIIGHITNAVCANGPMTLEEPGNPNDPMPPCSSPNGGTYSKRPQTDPIWQLGQLLKEWAAAGYPNQFKLGGASDGGASDGGAMDGGEAGAPTLSPYALTPALGNAMTNIGNCIPAALASIEDPKSAALDKMFASLAAQPSASTGAQQIGLPVHLSETDLFSLDSAELARYRVVAYAPTYPLWSDNAGKLRYVRVPFGMSIHFDKATQKFQIPPNTRFYKTFMKKIADTDGSYRFRKIETRLIVSRPDVNNSDGTAKAQTALFGSYQWTADEKDAILVTAALTSGEPFTDTLFPYNTDEQLAADVERGQPADLEQALLAARAARNYAIPSSQRCMQCHMGSPSEAFILGFTPLQINRRPTGTGGILPDTDLEAERSGPAGPDELTQLQRLVDYGVITGIDSPRDVLPLELSQGTRTPRNNYELVAQGYMLGNCAHCHNPRGFPSIQNPGLDAVLDMLPGPTGGIFQFPLERTSPYIARGLTGTTPIPFITPSLVDQPRVVTQVANGIIGAQAPDIFVNINAGSSSVPNSVIYAPWRSLIYRNTDAAFTYVDDVAVFPHMPFNAPGYDPRAKQIFSDWMVSIPAVRKRPDLVEYAYQVDDNPADNIGSFIVDSTPQPYVEVPPGAPGYDAALVAAQQRLKILHTGVNPALPITSGGVIYSRYSDPGETTDILDPAVTADPNCHPIPVGEPGPGAPYPFPNHPHWVITDTSLAPGPWEPRQSRWPQTLVEQEPSGSNTSGCESPSPGQTQAAADEAAAVALVQSATLDQVRGSDGTGFATTLLPFGLWQQQSGCTFPSSVHRAGSFTDAQRPHWMEVTNPQADAPVYEETPGAAVFKMICINCHGPNADAKGRLAANLATMTGGRAQVADFHDGLFGPATAPDTNIQTVFGQSFFNSIYTNWPDAGPDAGPETGAPQVSLAIAKSDWTSITPDDRAARYMPWMALGGTTVQIPQQILQIVAVTQVLGAQRVLPSTTLSANMLSEAKTLCLSFLGAPYQGAPTYTEWRPQAAYLDQAVVPTGGVIPSSVNSSLLLQNGDAELWLRLCAIANQPPIHVLRAPVATTTQLDLATGFGIEGNLLFDPTMSAAFALVDPSLYPAGATVGNERGGLDSGLVPPTATNVLPGATNPGNLWPWCFDDNVNNLEDQSAWVTYIAENNLSGYICPSSVKTVSENCALNPPVQPTGGSCFGNDRANQWAVRGAINAGMSVFLYVQSIETTGPAPDYNQCELLK
jgi:mono/diheme cytochrome c family protein